MARKHHPRRGSLAFYPRKKAAKETPSFRYFPLTDNVMPLAFYGYKAGMTHLIARNEHKKSVTYGQDLQLPVTVVEVPALRVFGIRTYGKGNTGNLIVLLDVLAEKTSKHLLRALHAIKKVKHSLNELDALKEGLVEVRLLCHTQPDKCGFGKKKPAITEIALGGREKIAEQLSYAKEKLGKELSISEVFKEKEFIDVKAVTKGQGMEGVVNRFGVKTLRHPKHKKERIIGSISPWHPPLVMWQVPRPGQQGYHSRTEFNKQILMMSNAVEKINPKGDFVGYGKVLNDFVLLHGTIPGPRKRLIGLRKAGRPAPLGELGEISFISLASKQ